MTERIPKRRKISQAILQSLGGGVVPRTGVEYIAVGREAEMAALDHDLDIIADGGASCRLIVGRYGAGKSFLLQLLRNHALQRRFVVADTEFNPQRRLTGSKGEGLTLYRELLTNMSIRTRPNGNAFPAILEKWISDIQAKVARAGLEPSSREFDRKVAGQVYQVIGEIEFMTRGPEFAEVLNKYWRAHRDGDDDTKTAAMRWLRGEFNGRRHAQTALGMRSISIIDDSTWYDYIKVLAYFVRQIGYRGLVICLDETVYLSRISNRTGRENNYQRLLDIYNDATQGNAEYLGILFGAIPMMVEDPRRGLYSYEALQSRLQESSFAKPGLRDLFGPIIRLDTLNADQQLNLFRTIRDIHAWHYRYEALLDDGNLRTILADLTSRVGAQTHLNPRDIIRPFVSLLNLLQQNPGQTFESILGDIEISSGAQLSLEDVDSPYASFQI